jgi:hypothetical protein
LIVGHKKVGIVEVLYFNNNQIDKESKMKKILLLVMITIFVGDAYSNSSHDMPIPTECSWCTVDADFKLHAKLKSPRNSVNYYLVFNKGSKLLKTVRVVDIYEPGDYLNISRQTIVNTLQEHQDSFDSYMLGKDDEVLELDYTDLNGRAAGSYSAFELNYGVHDALQNLLLAHLNTRHPFAGDDYEAITVTFSNGDVAQFGIVDGLKDTLMSISQIPFLLVVDKDGNPILVLATNGTVVSEVVGSGGGSGGGYTAFLLPSGVTICYGECPVRDGWVTIERNEEE